jgi:hypothetical protein
MRTDIVAGDTASKRVWTWHGCTDFLTLTVSTVRIGEMVKRVAVAAGFLSCFFFNLAPFKFWLTLNDNTKLDTDFDSFLRWRRINSCAPELEILRFSGCASLRHFMDCSLYGFCRCYGNSLYVLVIQLESVFPWEIGNFSYIDKQLIELEWNRAENCIFTILLGV